MATQVQWRRGTSAQVAAFTGALGEMVVNTTTNRLHTQDGVTAGGWAHALVQDVQQNKLTWATVGGTSDAITLTIAPAPGSIAAGTMIWFKATASNTTTTPNATIVGASGNLGPYTIQKAGNALAAGDIATGQPYGLLFDGTYLQLFAGVGAVPIVSNLPRVPRTANTMLAASNKANLIDVTANTFLQTTDLAANLGAGWWCVLRNSGSGVVQLQPGAGATAPATYTVDALSIAQLGTTLGSNPLTTVNNSAAVTVAHTAHGYSVGQAVQFSGASTFNNVTISGPYLITSTTTNTYTITAATNANASGSGGGASVVEIGSTNALPANPFTTVNLSSTVTVNHPNHPFQTGNVVSFSGTVSFANVTISGAYSITYVNANSYTITAGTTANASTSGGGSSCVYASSFFNFYPGEARILETDGMNFYTVLLAPGQVTFTSGGNFIVPPGLSWLDGDGVGGGAGGAGGQATAGTNGGGAGGAGGRKPKVRFTSLPAGQIIPIGIAAGGNGGAANTNGSVGGNTTFGAYQKWYGGGYGSIYDGTTDSLGGQGGGGIAAGSTGGYNTPPGPNWGNSSGSPNGNVLSTTGGNGCYSGAISNTNAEWGGAGGGSCGYRPGGSSMFGPGAGGGGGPNTPSAGGAAGISGGYANGLAQNGGAATGAAGGNGTSRSLAAGLCGDGGGGGGGNGSGAGGQGGNGGAPGGGGGGGGSGTTTGGAGGNGARGELLLCWG